MYLLTKKELFLWDNISAIQTFLNFLQRNSSEKSKKKLYVGSLLFLVYLRLFGVESCKKSRKDADKKNKRFFQWWIYVWFCNQISWTPFERIFFIWRWKQWWLWIQWFPCCKKNFFEENKSLIKKSFFYWSFC